MNDFFTKEALVDYLRVLLVLLLAIGADLLVNVVIPGLQWFNG